MDDAASNQLEASLSDDERALLDDMTRQITSGRVKGKLALSTLLAVSAGGSFLADMPAAMGTAFGAGAAIAGAAAFAAPTAAMVFLEGFKPFAFIGSQGMLLLRPLIALLWPNPLRWDRIQALLEKRGTIELLLRRIEGAEDAGPPPAAAPATADAQP